MPHTGAIFDTRLARLEEELAAERARHEKEAQEHGKIKEWASQLQASMRIQNVCRLTLWDKASCLCSRLKCNRKRSPDTSARLTLNYNVESMLTSCVTRTSFILTVLTHRCFSEQAECGELSGRVEGLQEELQLSRRSAEQLRRDREAAEAALQASREEAESLRTDLGRTNFRLGDMQEMLHRLQVEFVPTFSL